MIHYKTAFFFLLLSMFFSTNVFSKSFLCEEKKFRFGETTDGSVALMNTDISLQDLQRLSTEPTLKIFFIQGGTEAPSQPEAERKVQETFLKEVQKYVPKTKAEELEISCKEDSIPFFCKENKFRFTKNERGDLISMRNPVKMKEFLDFINDSPKLQLLSYETTIVTSSAAEARDLVSVYFLQEIQKHHPKAQSDDLSIFCRPSKQ